MEKRNSFSYYMITFLLIIIPFSLVFPSMKNVKFAKNADEGYYLRYANAISNKGLAEFRNLFRTYIEDDKNWVFPNPLRIGYITLASIWCKIFGNSFLALAYLSLFFYLLLIVTNFHFSCKFFDKEKAVLLSCLTAFSPIAMAMSRRALIESAATFFLAISIWLFLDMILKDKSIIKRVFFLLAFSFSVLIKETSVVLTIPFFAFLVIYSVKFKQKVRLQDFLYISVYPACIVGLVYLFASGNVLHIVEIVRAVSATVNINEYAVKFGGGPWYRYIIDFMLLSPWTLILSIGFIFYLIRNFKESEAGEAYFLVILLVLFFLFNLLTKNVRYVMILDLPIRLFAILMLYKLSPAKLKNSMRFMTIASIVLLICIADFITFREFFIRKEIYDPVSFWLLGLRDIIPLK